MELPQLSSPDVAEHKHFCKISQCWHKSWGLTAQPPLLPIWTISFFALHRLFLRSNNDPNRFIFLLERLWDSEGRSPSHGIRIWSQSGLDGDVVVDDDNAAADDYDDNDVGDDNIWYLQYNDVDHVVMMSSLRAAMQP